jgi:hypothetical protein
MLDEVVAALGEAVAMDGLQGELLDSRLTFPSASFNRD